MYSGNSNSTGEGLSAPPRVRVTRRPGEITISPSLHADLWSRTLPAQKVQCQGVGRFRKPITPSLTSMALGTLHRVSMHQVLHGRYCIIQHFTPGTNFWVLYRKSLLTRKLSPFKMMVLTSASLRARINVSLESTLTAGPGLAAAPAHIPGRMSVETVIARPNRDMIILLNAVATQIHSVAIGGAALQASWA